MSRRRRKFKDEDEESLWIKIAVGIGGVLVLAAVGWFIFYKSQLKEAASELDSATFCPKDGARAITAVLVDRTDGINPVQADALRNLMLDWADKVPVHGAFRVYEVGAEYALQKPIVEVCNPGNTANSFTGNIKITKDRYEAKFKQPIEKMLTGMLTDKEANASPIMEAVQAIAIKEFARRGKEAAGEAGEDAKSRLYIVSDLLQHSSALDLYKKAPNADAFNRSIGGAKLSVDLNGIEAYIYLMHSKSPKQTGDVVMFWLEWLQLQGADVMSQIRVPG